MKEIKGSPIQTIEEDKQTSMAFPWFEAKAGSITQYGQNSDDDACKWEISNHRKSMIF